MMSFDANGTIHQQELAKVRKFIWTAFDILIEKLLSNQNVKGGP
jgi:hypothetical protein